MTDQDKKIHDLKFELRQQRLRCDKLEQELINLKKTVVNIMMADEIVIQVLNSMTDDIKELKEEKK